MFKPLVFVCIIAAVLANPGVLAPSLRIAAAPTIVRTAPIALGANIGAPLVLNRGIVSNGLISNGLISGGLISNGLVSNGLVSGGVLSSGKLLSGGLLG